MVTHDFLMKLVDQYPLPSNVIMQKKLRSLANHVFLLSSKKQKWILKIYNEVYSANVPNRHNILIYLQQETDIPIPKFIQNLYGETFTIIDGVMSEITEYIEHKTLSYAVMNISNDELRAASLLLSKIHSISLSDLPTPITTNGVIDTPGQIFRLLQNFQCSFEQIKKQLPREYIHKLNNLLVIINETQKYRGNISHQRFNLSPNVFTHGDFSLSNLLPTIEKKIYVIDWDNMAIRPRIWEFHRTMMLLCGKGHCNANFDALDFSKAKIFFNSYNKYHSLSQEEISILPKVAEYFFSLHWLEFTLQSLLSGNNRPLELIPDNVQDGLWWIYHFNDYVKWLEQISS